MIEYVKKVFQNYATFSGRANRPEFWWFYLFLIIVCLVLGALSTMASFIGIFLGLFMLAIIVPYIAVGVRRMHDVGKSGWYLLIPIYNLVLLCTEGQPGSNEYGPNPNEAATSGFDFDQQKLQS